MRRPTRAPRGFSLVELMLVVAMMGILGSVALNQFRAQVMRAKRTEAVINLSTIWSAQRAFLGASGRYAATFDELGFLVEGGNRVSDVVYVGDRYTYQLSQPWGSTSFYCTATAELDGDAWPDILETYETNGD